MLITELQSTVQGESSEKYHLIKTLLIGFYFIMAFKECFNALEGIGHQIIKIKDFWIGIEFENMLTQFLTVLMHFTSFSIQFCFFGLQIFLSLYLSKINLIIIQKEEDLLNLIQNYSALAAILELDNIIVLFLRYIGILNLFKFTLELFGVDFSEDSKEEHFQILDFWTMFGEIAESAQRMEKNKISAFIKYIISYKSIKIILNEEKYEIKENLNKLLLSLFKILLILGAALLIFRQMDNIE